MIEAPTAKGWSDERRQAASRAAKARIAAYAEKQAAEKVMEPQIQEHGPIPVAITEPEGVGPSSLMMLRAQLQRDSQIEENFAGDANGRVQVSGIGLNGNESFGGPEDGVIIRAVSHKRSRRIRLYKPYPTCIPAAIPAENFDAAIIDGWKDKCPECKTDCGGSPWGCGKTPEPQYLQCEEPSCRRKFWYMSRPQVETQEDENPLRVKNPFLEDQDGTATAAMAARADYLAHMSAYHEQLARAMKLPGLADR